MFYRLRNSIARRRFRDLTSRVLDVKPMPVVHDGLAIVSMVSNDDIQMYLLSMHSFYARIGKGRLVVIVDRDMPAESRGLLAEHFPGIEFVILEDIPVGPCQRGGTWERLHYLLGLSRDEYVIQLDCDTLTYGADLSEALDCVRRNRAFTLSGTELEIVSAHEAARRARAMDDPYVGIAAEALYDQLPDARALRYVRGSSGFAGFARGGFEQARIEEFHVRMEALMPERWKEWGTEQCASNFAVANSPDAVVLPFPKYANYGPDCDPSRSGFLHFIGTYRFHDDVFAKLGNAVIDRLGSR